jgi:Putative beta-barrel porin-2, OmpL-like. bbp2
MPTDRLVTASLLILLAASQAWARNTSAAPAAPDSGDTTLRQQVVELRALVEKLQARVDELEKRSDSPAVNAAPTQQPQAQTVAAQSPASASTVSGFLHDTTINLLMDGYYAYNLNDPIGRVNLLRAYDVSSNAFSLNQAALVIENSPDPDNGKRFGLRLDFQYGQATETLQGNPANEPRPDIYRNIFQAYGTYVFPIGKGLTVDFGKFASSLGMEGNYTKDQINYSRSYWFAFLPFYHMGVRANYKFSKQIAFNYWIVNGTQQTEPFNGFKDQFVGFTITPNDKVTWNVNYYLGQEHPDVAFFPNGGAPPNLPTEQGVPFEPILNPPAGKLHIFDTYMTWQATPKLTLALEADDEIERLFTYSTPSHAAGGAGYFRYQLTPKIAVGMRAEYLSDRGGLFSGVTQALKETTFTTEYKFVEGFLARGEWRSDFSNQPYFLTDVLGRLKKDQNTATLGLIWWMGGKQGAW